MIPNCGVPFHVLTPFDLTRSLRPRVRMIKTGDVVPHLLSVSEVTRAPDDFSKIKM